MTSYALSRPEGVVEMLWKPFGLEPVLRLLRAHTGCRVAQAEA